MFPGSYLPRLYIANNGNLKLFSPALYSLNMTCARVWLEDYNHNSESHEIALAQVLVKITVTLF